MQRGKHVQAVILAAGLGTRLGGLTAASAKCMVPLHGRRLIERLLVDLAGLGLRRAVLVIGHGGQELRDTIGERYAGLPCVYVENPVYHSTNNIYSLAMAAPQLCEHDTLLIESDLALDAAILHACAEAPAPAAVVAPFAPWMDGTAVLLDCAGRVSRFVPRAEQAGLDLSRAYKTVNLYKLDAAFSARCLVPALHRQLDAVGAHVYYETVFGQLVAEQRMPMQAVVVRKARWYEIDTPADLHAAEALFAAEVP